MRSHAFDGSKTPAASSPDACFPATAGRMRSMESRRGRRPNAVIAFAHERELASSPPRAGGATSPAHARSWAEGGVRDRSPQRLL